jgi:hypothetical protein
VQFLGELAVRVTNFVCGRGPAHAECGIWIPTQSLRRAPAFCLFGRVAVLLPKAKPWNHTPRPVLALKMLWLTPRSSLW